MGEDISKVIKQEKFKDSYQKAVINLIYTSNYFRDIHASIFSKFNIQSQHFNILRILNGQYPNPCSPGYIKNVMLDKGRDLTRLINKLVKLGWVHRQICETNRRKVELTLTPEGKEKIDNMSEILLLKEQKLKKMSDDDYELLSTLLDKMRS
ncbi:MAG: hypothetical protein R2774_14120 [Saprospiraceae bacterium]